MFGIAQVAFHDQANGSPVSYHGHVVGSSLLCQEFTGAKGAPLVQYFQPRPSNAARRRPQTTMAATPAIPPRPTWAPTTGPGQAHHPERRAGRMADVSTASAPASVPPDAVTASAASGLDPDIAPPYAYLQANRVAAAPALSPATVRALVGEPHPGPHPGVPG